MNSLIAAHPDSDLKTRLAWELEQIELHFARELRSDSAAVNFLTEHVERYRGKMLRPSLVVLSYWACMNPASVGSTASSEPATTGNAVPRTLAVGEVGGERGRRVHPQASDSDRHHAVAAAIVEMVHVATLVHDDVLDGAITRRRGATINQMTGIETAVMLGDFLFSHAFEMCLTIPDLRVARTLVSATTTVCEGEVEQLANRGNWDLDEATYMRIIDRKTASLCGACGRVGAMLAGADSVQRDALADYGRNLGKAFQIIDDLLDLLGEEKVVGKSLGRDVAKGKLTLPLVHLLETAPQAVRADVIARLDRVHEGHLAHEAAVSNGQGTTTHDAGRNDPMHDDTGRNESRHSDAGRNDPRHDGARHSDARHSESRHDGARHSDVKKPGRVLGDDDAATCADLAKLAQLVTEHGSVRYSRAVAASLIDQAMACLGPLPESNVKRMLLDIAQNVLVRDR